MTTFLMIGLIGALLMFAGDMCLYYDKDDYQDDGTMQPIINIMKKKNKAWLYLGGILGSVASFVYCVGYYHTVLFIADDRYRFIGWICFLINSLGIILGGAFHMQCANLGLIARHDNEATMKEVTKYLTVISVVSFGIMGIGFVILSCLIAFGLTVLPKWMFFVSPLFLFFLRPIVKKLPKGFHMIIYGGWTNWISIIYYVVAMSVMW